MRAFRLAEDARGEKAYAAYLEARAKDRKGVVSDSALVELRRGWVLGEKTFVTKVLDAVRGLVGVDRKKGSVGGEAARAHHEAESERIVSAALAELGAPSGAADLSGRGKWKAEKDMVAALVRNRTSMPNRWVADRLGMGHEVSVTRAVRRYREDKRSADRLVELAARLGI